MGQDKPAGPTASTETNVTALREDLDRLGKDVTTSVSKLGEQIDGFGRNQRLLEEQNQLLEERFEAEPA